MPKRPEKQPPLDQEKISAILGAEPEPLNGRTPMQAYIDRRKKQLKELHGQEFTYHGRPEGEASAK